MTIAKIDSSVTNISIDELSDMVTNEVHKKLNINKVIHKYDHIIAQRVEYLRDEIGCRIANGWHLYGQMFRDEDGWGVQPMVKYEQ
jgi:hypothetical protein